MTWLPGFEPDHVAGCDHDGGGDRWFTPAPVGAAVTAVLGDRWIDPCGDPLSPLTRLASAWLDVREGDDGLLSSWPDGPAFVNPPFSDASKWIERCWQESGAGRRVMLLVPLRPEGLAWHRCIWPGAQVVIPRGRLRFVGLDGQAHGNATIGTAFVCWGFDGQSLRRALLEQGLDSVLVEAVRGRDG